MGNLSNIVKSFIHSHGGEINVFKNGNYTNISDRPIKALKNQKKDTKAVIFQFESPQDIGFGDVINQMGARDRWIVKDMEDVIVQGKFSHFEVTVEKESSKSNPEPVDQAPFVIPQTVYNFNAPNSRVYSQSTDNSTNIFTIDANVIQTIQALRTELDRTSLPEEVKADAHDTLDAIEEQFKSGSPKKSIISTLLKSLPQVETVTSIAANILPFLHGM